MLPSLCHRRLMPFKWSEERKAVGVSYVDPHMKITRFLSTTTELLVEAVECTVSPTTAFRWDKKANQVRRFIILLLPPSSPMEHVTSYMHTSSLRGRQNGRFKT